MAFFDDSTDLPNIQHLILDLTEAVQRSNENENEVLLFGLHIKDMDRINQKLGFSGGDQLLVQIARQFNSLKNNFGLYRISGTDFAFLARSSFKPEIINEFQQHILSILKRPYLDENHNIRIKGLMTGTIAPRDGRNSNHLIQNLFNTSTRIKSANNPEELHWYDPEDFQILKRQFLIEESLSKALENHGFHIAIQPKYHMKDKIICGGEVLARWEHPEMGVISPMEFIPLLESSGLMVSFTREMIELGITLKKLLTKAEMYNMVIAVNLSASALVNPELISILIDFARYYKPLKLEIEITEDVFLSFNNSILKTLQQLKSAGLTIALDDFGTGFSNMQYLQQIDVDVIKIDRSFISPLPSDENSIEIVRAMITLAQAFSIEVVAEGAETDEQICLLRTMGCDIIQGYGVGKPMSLNEFKDFIVHFKPKSEWG